MPQAVTHVLAAIIIAEIIRDYVVKDKKKFPLHYVLIAGVAGLLPDIDIIAYWVLYWFGFTLNEVHRTFSHNLFVPLVFLIIAGITWRFKNKELGKHHLKLHNILLMISLGVLVHLALDATIGGYIMPFYPFSTFAVGLNLVSALPPILQQLALPTLDAILLILWLVHEEFRHKISSFI